MYYTCDKCNKSFTRSYNLTRHCKESCPARFECTSKPKKRRLNDTTSSVKLTCDVCNVIVPQNRMLTHERTLEHRNKSCVTVTRGVQCIESAFKNRIVTYRFNSDIHHVDYVTFFEEVKPKVITVLQDILRACKSTKVNMVAIGRYFLPTSETSSEKSFNTPNQIVTVGSDLDDIYQSFADVMKTQAAEFQEKDSGMLKII